ncbi:MAG: peptidoglycan bridge formation glycyltransferase FemA/FemB family protein [Anaerolineales bacterium]|nr:peptidoglycan bridge formation glycyltransferase FemA/FemB family protein [Anaerolineales bacterium]
MELTTQTIDDAADWHQLLTTFPNAHPLQTWTWGAFKSRWGWSAQQLAFYNNEQELVAAALLLKRPIPRTPFSILYTPKGPVFDEHNRPLREALLAKLEAIARQSKAIFLKIDPDVVRGYGDEEVVPQPAGVELMQLLEKRGWCFSDDQIQFRNTVTMDITRPEEELLADMKSKTRYNIRLAGRKDVVVREGTPTDFDMIYAMYAETAARDGFIIRPRAYYLDGWQALYDADLAMPLIAEFEGTPLGAVVIVKFNQKAIYMYGASTDLERNRMPNYLLQWEAIRWAKAHGCSLYDFWGAPDEFEETDSMWGVWRFKKGFNGQVARHIGAWDYAARPWLYKLYTQAIPKYLALLKRWR